MHIPFICRYIAFYRILKKIIHLIKINLLILKISKMRSIFKSISILLAITIVNQKRLAESQVCPLKNRITYATSENFYELAVTEVKCKILDFISKNLRFFKIYVVIFRQRLFVSSYQWTEKSKIIIIQLRK